MLQNNSPFGNMWTQKFSDIYDSLDKFVEDFNNIGINGLNYPVNNNTQVNIKTLFYLLYGEYGNNNIINFDINQFKFKLFSIIYMYGPTWEKRLEIQNKVRQLTEDEIRQGTASINNYAQATGADDTNTKDTKDLNGVNNQSRTMYEKDKLTAYNNLSRLLETDITKEFVNKFKKLFLQILQPNEPLYYKSED